MTCIACSNVAIYGLPDTIPITCIYHSSIDMVDLRHVKCALCNSRPTYSYPNKPWSHCRTHSSKGMKVHYIKRKIRRGIDGKFYRANKYVRSTIIRKKLQNGGFIPTCEYFVAMPAELTSLESEYVNIV